MKIEIGYSLSPIAQDYVAQEENKSVNRRREFTCSPIELSNLLSDYGLPVSNALLDFEDKLGGWSYGTDSEYGIGIFYSLQQGENISSVANRFRKLTYLFDQPRDQPNSDGDYLPIWGTGFPHLFFQDQQLIPAGMLSPQLLYFINLQGEIFLYQLEVDTLLLVAGSGHSLLENEALIHSTPEWNTWSRVHLCINAKHAETLANKLNVDHNLSCSDHLFKVWANSNFQIRSIPDVAPCIAGISLSAQKPEDLIEAVKIIQQLDNQHLLKIWERANNLQDAKGLQLLQNSSIQFELFQGAAPGHYDFIVDGETGREYYQPSGYQSRMK